MNKHHGYGAGYTIFEVMIFLAVSSALFFATIAALLGQQARQGFYQSIRETDAKIRDVMNDFATGFFPGGENLSCSADAGGNAPVQGLGPSGQGTRVGCTFVGKVIQFAPAGSNGEGYRVITVIGRQFKGAILSEPVENIVEAKPVPLGGDAMVNEAVFGYGLRVGSMTYTDSAGLQRPIGAIGFFSSFTDVKDGDPVSGKQSTQTIVIPGTELGQDPGAVNDAIRAIGSANWSDFASAYINRPINICFVSDTDQRGIISIGENRRQIVTALSIERGSVCS